MSVRRHSSCRRSGKGSESKALNALRRELHQPCRLVTGGKEEFECFLGKAGGG